MYGLDYRYLPDHFRNPNPDFVLWEPASRNQQLFSVFLQDEIELIEDHLRFTLGSKLEHNDFTGWEAEPNARLAYLITPRQTLWGAISRAVQVPGRNANDITTLLPFPPQPGPAFLAGTGNRDIQAQELLSYEIGYRIQATDPLSFDITTFYNDYDRFITGKVGTPYSVATPTPHYIVPIVAVNGGRGRSYGIEVASEWHATDWWRLVGTYSLLRIELNQFAASLSSEGKDPHHQASLRSSMDLPGNLELDVWGRFVDQLPTFGVSSYFDLDVRLGWKPYKNWEVSLVGQNLLQENRFEFGTSQFTQTIATPVPRGVYGQIAYKF